MRTGLPIWVRTVAATLLFAMVYYFAGYRIVYFVIMHNAKSDAVMTMKYNKASLQNLTMDSKEYSKLKWTETGKEFSYNGQLYDAVSITKGDNSYNMMVYADKNETHWTQALNDFVKEFFTKNNTDCGKGMKTAEAMVSAFQKEYTPLVSMKVRLPEKQQVSYFSSDREAISIDAISSIWHPPSNC